MYQLFTPTSTIERQHGTYQCGEIPFIFERNFLIVFSSFFFHRWLRLGGRSIFFLRWFFFLKSIRGVSQRSVDVHRLQRPSPTMVALSLVKWLIGRGIRRPIVIGRIIGLAVSLAWRSASTSSQVLLFFRIVSRSSADLCPNDCIKHNILPRFWTDFDHLLLHFFCCL